MSAPSSRSRANSWGDALKYKFYETASFLVTRINKQRSVQLSLLKQSDLVPAGKATIPPNHPVPPVGAIVEVRYLYAFRESGSVYQPVYLRERSDITADQCTVEQLKYKEAA